VTIADLCLLAAVVLTIAAIAPAKLDGGKQFDNANPRDPAFYTPGLRARSQGAHQNCLEALPFFAAAVLLAEMHGASQGIVNALALAFLLARIIYVVLYIRNHPTARSVTWSVAFALNVALFLTPLWAH
jgi:uncharacterized MAPEG superfamily protein